MTYFSHIRAGLIASALLLTTALASPAIAETLPEISPRQIASDVKMQYNPQTGAREYIAPSFDPFEEDRNMAGTSSLRSVSQATTIDGQSVRGGALLDMTFYYNSQSNDPYDTRGYEDAVYLSGEYAPVTRRDSRILECNEKVQDVVYYHEDYYRPSLYVNLFRPYRHYRGHYGFGRSYGYDYGRSYRGYRGYRGGRGYRRGHDGDRQRTRHHRDRAVDDTRRTHREDRHRDRADRNRNHDAGETRRTRRDRNRNTAETRRDRQHVLDGRHRMGTNAGAAGRRDNTRRSRNDETQRERRIDRRVTPQRAEIIRRDSRLQATPRAATPRPAPRASNPASAPTSRAATPAPRPERAAPAPRRQRAERSRPSRAERAARRANEIKSRNAPRRHNGLKGNTKRRLMGFLPMASAWSRNVVRNVDTQCAREEMLTVHIPQERLDAARFDGLTVLVLDRAGEEIPVFVPPNYIEGFRQAIDGRITPNVPYQEPYMSAPVYQAPGSSTLNSAPCPVGTTKQSDGTCLQGGTVTYGGYPTR